MKVKIGRFSNIVVSIIILLVPLICYFIFSRRQLFDIYIFTISMTIFYIIISFSFFTAFLIEDNKVIIVFFNFFKKNRIIEISQIKHIKIVRNSIRGTFSVVKFYYTNDKTNSIYTMLFRRELKALFETFKKKGIDCVLIMY